MDHTNASQWQSAVSGSADFVSLAGRAGLQRVLIRRVASLLRGLLRVSSRRQEVKVSWQ
ncbi:hypothetical protein [Alteraurantiacibacter aestuarii]|uniref:hypothetical protein n=1 Tax=Alteraurantiacibacter aestuarii TaxID=650004 RepID=UPI00137216D6|nr:hypothetical protein [Alteraurantiacibacter aestuarii]